MVPPIAEESRGIDGHSRNPMSLVSSMESPRLEIRGISGYPALSHDVCVRHGVRLARCVRPSRSPWRQLGGIPRIFEKSEESRESREIPGKL